MTLVASSGNEEPERVVSGFVSRNSRVVGHPLQRQWVFRNFECVSSLSQHALYRAGRFSEKYYLKNIHRKKVTESHSYN